jgi:CRP/FNR family transcriptional regulator, cyclic AMP receptor protein
MRQGKAADRARGKAPTADRAENCAALMAMFACSAGSATVLLDACTLQHYPRGTILAHQGDDLPHGWILLDGAASYQSFSVDGRAVQLAVFGSGDLLGAYDQRVQLAADLMALTPLVTLKFRTGGLAVLAEQHPDIGLGLSRVFARQLQALMNRLISRTTLTAPGRIYTALLAAAQSDGTIAPAPTVSMLAIQAQTTRETASRALALLDRRGILQRESRQWRVISSRLLEELIV